MLTSSYNQPVMSLHDEGGLLACPLSLLVVDVHLRDRVEVDAPLCLALVYEHDYDGGDEDGQRFCHLWLVSIVDKGSLVTVEDKPTSKKRCKPPSSSSSLSSFYHNHNHRHLHCHHHHHHYQPTHHFHPITILIVIIAKLIILIHIIIVTYSILWAGFPVCSDIHGSCSCWSRCACTARSAQ